MRKYSLYIVLGGILAVYGGQWVVNTVLTGPLEKLESKRAGYERKIKKAKKELSEAVAAAKRLNEYEQRSLPSNPEVARSHYQAWLLELVDHVGLTDRTVNSSPAGTPKRPVLGDQLLSPREGNAGAVDAIPLRVLQLRPSAPDSVHFHDAQSEDGRTRSFHYD